MRKAIILIAALILVLPAVRAQQAPPAQEKPAQAPQPQAPQQPKDVKYTNDTVARMSFVEGKTFIQRASDLGYEEGVLNMPVTEGDRLGTSDGRMEVRFGRANYVRLDNNTKLDFLNLPKKGDDIVRMRVWSGSIYMDVGTLAKEKAIEIHTADSSFYVLDKGVYRVNVRENHDTEILVLRGLIEAAGEGGSTLIKSEQRLEIAEGRFSGKPSQFIDVADDGFDRFNQSRNSQLSQQFAKDKRYLPEELSDFEGELAQNGKWAYLAPYGNVWVPNDVREDWRPYYDGRWVYLGMSGWTWLPYEPWGWTTSHYGRWHWGADFGWYWIPTAYWGPGWVNWWWDDFYYGWGPMGYWGYPGLYFGFNLWSGFYYGFGWGWGYGGYYPYYPGHYPPGGHYPYYHGGGRGLTIVHRNQLKDPHIRSVALRDAATLRSLSNSKMSFSAHAPNVRPSGTRISIQQLNGNRVMLRNDGGSGGLVPDRAIGRDSLSRPKDGSSSGTSVRRDGGSQGKGSSSPSVGKSSGSGKSASSGKSTGSGKSSGSSKSSGSGARRIRKDEAGPAAASGMSAGTGNSGALSLAPGVRSAEPRAVRTYPSSPAISRPQGYYGDGGAGRSQGYSGRILGSPSSGRSYGSSPSTRPGSSSSGRSTVRSGSSSGRSSVSRGSSSGSRSGSSGRVSSGSHSGGGVRKK